MLEGGAIQVDGEGTWLAGTGPLLDPKRNPGRSRDEIEAELGSQLGVTKVIWLPAGLSTTKPVAMSTMWPVSPGPVWSWR